MAELALLVAAASYLAAAGQDGMPAEPGFYLFAAGIALRALIAAAARRLRGRGIVEYPD